MIPRTHHPSAPLSRFVDMLWFYSGQGPTHRKERVLPDGTAELVINLDDVARKRFCRIRRFQKALGDIQVRRKIEWTDVAYANGYCDQAHLIHDFRAFSGLTPSAYLGQAGADARFVPIDD